MHNEELILQKHTSGNQKLEEDASKDTETKLADIKKIGKSKGSKVVDDLLRAVVTVVPS
jgi:V-type H+-transporting ATPase subunit G